MFISVSIKKEIYKKKTGFLDCVQFWSIKPILREDKEATDSKMWMFHTHVHTGSREDLYNQNSYEVGTQGVGISRL